MISYLKLYLDNDTKVYAPGDEIKGSVSIKGLKSADLALAGLNVQLIGSIHTLQVQGPYSELTETRIICDEVVTLFSESSNERSRRSHSTFPFSLTIPENLPCSISVNRDNAITYKLKAALPGAKTVKSTDRNIYLVGSVFRGDVEVEKIKSHAAVASDTTDILISYGSDTPEHSDTASLPSYASKGPIFPQSFEPIITMEVGFPQPGIYTDDPLYLPTVLYFPGEQPPMVSKSLKVILTEETKISAKSQYNKEVKHHTLFSLKEKIDVSTSPVHDFTELIMQEARIPQLPPDFSEETMSRSYVWNVHASLYKGDLKTEVPLAGIHLNARNDLRIFGRRDEKTILPSFSRSY